MLETPLPWRPFRLETRVIETGGIIQGKLKRSKGKEQEDEDKEVEEEEVEEEEEKSKKGRWCGIYPHAYPISPSFASRVLLFYFLCKLSITGSAIQP